MGNNIDGRNRASPEEMKSFVERYENLLADKASEHGSYMKRCGEIQADINELLEEAKGRGLPKKSVKAVIERRKLQRKLDGIDENLDDDQKAVSIDIREALNEFVDTPLGAAAVSREEAKQDDTTAAIVSAVQNDEQLDIEKEAEKQKIADQRAADDKAFSDVDQSKPLNVTSIDPKAARANRTKKSTGEAETKKAASGEVTF